VISGIELAEKIKKGQFKKGKLGWAPSDDSADLAGCVGRLISIVIETAIATEIVAPLNLHQSHANMSVQKETAAWTKLYNSSLK